MNWNNILNRRDNNHVMANVSYDIIEKDTNREKIDIDEIFGLVNVNSISNRDMNMDCMIASEIDYCNNYNIKSLGKILDFYGICKRKLRKDEMIQTIILFETDLSNYELVEQRKRLWINFKELKEHSFFNKFMILDL